MVRGWQSVPAGAPAGRSRVPSAVIGGIVIGFLIALVALPSHGGRGGAGGSVALSGSGPGAGAPAGTGVGPGGGASPVSGSTQASGTLTAAAGSAGAGSPAGTASGTTQTAATGTGSRAATGTAGSGGNGGATFRGVTGSTITIGVSNLDSSDLAPVCPRCNNGPASTGSPAFALVAAWHHDGLLPINGRDIKVVSHTYPVLDSAQQRNVCLQFAQQDHAFAVIDDNESAPTVATCLAQEFHIFVVTGLGEADEATLRNSAPYLYEVSSGREKGYRNFVHWLDAHGLLKGQTIGLYSASDSVTAGTQEVLNASLRPELRKAGYKLAVDQVSDGQQDDAVAVERFRAANVTVALVLTDLLEFQQASAQQGYHPKYPQADVDGLLTCDACSDIEDAPSEMDGNLGMATSFWDWAKRSPATPANNPTAAYCLNAYMQYTHRTLDVYTNDSEIRYVLDMCSPLEVIRRALVAAGPTVNDRTFIQGMYTIHGMQTSEWPSVSFGPGKPTGEDWQSTVEFKKSHWQPSGDYWARISGWSPFWVN